MRMPWDPFFNHLSEVVGAPSDQIKLICSLVAAFPLASIFVQLPAKRPNVAHLFSLAATTFVLWPFLGLGLAYLELIASCVVTYVIIASFKGPNMPWIAFFFVMGHLTLTHVRRFIWAVPVTEIEISGAQMVLVMKLSTLAWNVHDGRRKTDDLDEVQTATRLSHLPNPLAFFGYCFFFPTVLVGPSFDYASYDALIKHTLYTTPPPESKSKVWKRTPHGRRRVALLHFAIGIFFLGVFATLNARGDFARVLTPTWYAWGHAQQFGFIQFCAFVARSKYYSVWSLTDGACILTGLGFNGYDPKTGRTLWNRVRNINILSIETAESFKVLLDSWNCRTNVWLRECVYKRLAKKGQKPGTFQSMATFVTSAFWHGVDPGYYLAFVTCGLYSYLGRLFRHLVRPYFLPASSTGAANSLPRWPYPNLAKRVYDVVGWACVQTGVAYAVVPFFVLQFKKSILTWARVYFYGHVSIFAAIAFFKFGGSKWLRRGLKPKAPRVKIPADVPSFKVQPPSPDVPTPAAASSAATSGAATPARFVSEADEADDRNMDWVVNDLQNRDENFSKMTDEILSGFDTPRSGTPTQARKTQ